MGSLQPVSTIGGFMPQIELPHTRESVDLALLLAVCTKLTQAWGRPLPSTSLPMPIYTSQLSLANRLAVNREYAYSFDMACRVVSNQPDTKSATNVFFDNVDNAKWFKKVRFENGLATRDGNRRTIFCAQFTQNCIEYWEGLPAGQKENALGRAQDLVQQLLPI